MRVNTRIFGEIDIEEEKIITFENGIIGFSDMKHFTLLHDEESGDSAGIRYLQSLDEPAFAMPVMDPLLVMPDYSPDVEDELLKPLGQINQDSLLVFVTVSVPKEIEKMSVNLQAPLVINADERKAVQIIVEGSEYKIKFPIYDILQARKQEAEERSPIC